MTSIVCDVVIVYRKVMFGIYKVDNLVDLVVYI